MWNHSSELCNVFLSSLMLNCDTIVVQSFQLVLIKTEQQQHQTDGPKSRPDITARARSTTPKTILHMRQVTFLQPNLNPGLLNRSIKTILCCSGFAIGWQEPIGDHTSNTRKVTSPTVAAAGTVRSPMVASAGELRVPIFVLRVKRVKEEQKLVTEVTRTSRGATTPLHEQEHMTHPRKLRGGRTCKELTGDD